MIDVTNVSFGFGMRRQDAAGGKSTFQFRRRSPPLVQRKPEQPQQPPAPEPMKENNNNNDDAKPEVQVLIAPESVIKHPLENTWTLWYFAPERNKSWEESQRKVASFSTCEDFWGLYNHIRKASEISFGCDFSMFKDDIRPMWEDAANKNGGRWLVNLERGRHHNHRSNGQLDRYWLEILLCMIGEAFGDFSQDVCGAVFNARPRVDKLAVWTANSRLEASVMGIGLTLKKRMELGNMPMEYGSHADSAAKVRGSGKKVLI